MGVAFWPKLFQNFTALTEIIIWFCFLRFINMVYDIDLALVIYINRLMHSQNKSDLVTIYYFLYKKRMELDANDDSYHLLDTLSVLCLCYCLTEPSGQLREAGFTVPTSQMRRPTLTLVKQPGLSHSQQIKDTGLDRSLWVIMSLLKEEMLSGGTLLASLAVGRWEGEQGWGNRVFLTGFSGCPFLSFLSCCWDVKRSSLWGLGLSSWVDSGAQERMGFWSQALRSKLPLTRILNGYNLGPWKPCPCGSQSCGPRPAAVASPGRC